MDVFITLCSAAYFVMGVVTVNVFGVRDFDNQAIVIVLWPLFLTPYLIWRLGNVARQYF